MEPKRWLACAALALAVGVAQSADIPWKMDNYAEPAPAATAEASWAALTHWEWYTAFSEATHIVAEFATVLFLR